MKSEQFFRVEKRESWANLGKIQKLRNDPEYTEYMAIMDPVIERASKLTQSLGIMQEIALVSHFPLDGNEGLPGGIGKFVAIRLKPTYPRMFSGIVRNGIAVVPATEASPTTMVAINISKRKTEGEYGRVQVFEVPVINARGQCSRRIKVTGAAKSVEKADILRHLSGEKTVGDDKVVAVIHPLWSTEIDRVLNFSTRRFPSDEDVSFAAKVVSNLGFRAKETGFQNYLKIAETILTTGAA